MQANSTEVRRVGLLAGLLLLLISSTTSAPRWTGDFTLAACSAGDSRALSISYRSPLRAPAGATALLEVPAGLGVGDRLPMTIENVPDSSSHDVVVRYWGSAEKAPKGQPEFFDQTVPMHRRGSTAACTEPHLSALKGSSNGTYRLTTSYAGGATLTLGPAQEHLAPITFTNAKTADYTRPIRLSWNPVPRAVGYSVQAAGLHRATGRDCLWEATRDGLTAWSALGTTRGVAKGKLLAADQHSCTIPAGVFKNGDVFIILVAYSADVVGQGSLPSRGWAQCTGTQTLKPRL